MKIMLDCSPAKIAEYRKRHDFDFWQLRTPLTQYARATVPYGLDNGCFKKFQREIWERLLAEAQSDRPVFCCLPDIVGDAARTLELFEHFKAQTEGLPRALVLQDGVERTRIPWDDIAAVFIGGSDRFKTSPEAFAAAKTAAWLGKHIHIGRVNTPERAIAWIEWAASCDVDDDDITIDGSGISRYDHMLLAVLRAIRGQHPQQKLIA